MAHKLEPIGEIRRGISPQLFDPTRDLRVVGAPGARRRTAAQEQVPARADAANIVAVLNRELDHRGTYLRFQLVGDAGDLQVHVVDSQTGEVVRKMPPDYLYQVRETIRDGVGVIVNDEAD